MKTSKAGSKDSLKMLPMDALILAMHTKISAAKKYESFNALQR